ncbi:hypothetical protein J6590_034657 [Homalodisca vitripennis]|nr:hypothetical protein J6590_034657 [Homalodisca vitripennis]
MTKQQECSVERAAGYNGPVAWPRSLIIRPIDTTLAHTVFSVDNREEPLEVGEVVMFHICCRERDEASVEQPDTPVHTASIV